MEILGKILGVLVLLGLGFLLFNYIKHNRDGALSKENLNQSVTTLGILGLILIALVAFSVMALRAS